MNLVFLRYPNWYRGLLEVQVGNMPVRVQVSPGGLLRYSSYSDKAETLIVLGQIGRYRQALFTSVPAYFCRFS